MVFFLDIRRFRPKSPICTALIILDDDEWSGDGNAVGYAGRIAYIADGGSLVLIACQSKTTT